MQIMTRTVYVAGSLCVIALLACKSNAPEEEEAVEEVDCETPAKLTCSVNDTCHVFFSSNSGQQISSDCVALGGTVSSGGCPQTFTQCCLKQKGSYDQPEAVCINDSNVGAGDFRAACRQLTNTTYCSAE